MSFGYGGQAYLSITIFSFKNILPVVPWKCVEQEVSVHADVFMFQPWCANAGQRKQLQWRSRGVRCSEHGQK
jgi:hypothetical protein